MAIGFDRPLYILPFDHRGTFQKTMFGWSGTLTVEQTARIVDMKRVIYDGFKAAVADGVPPAKAGILVDEQFGAEILLDAARHGYKTAAAAPGFIGFAVGRTSFWGPLTDRKDGRITREAAVGEIARRYSEWVDTFESAALADVAAVARGGRA
jgi:myo-inositol catabolism protein IolC